MQKAECSGRSSDSSDTTFYCFQRHTLKLSMTARTAVPACLNASDGSGSQEPPAAKTPGRRLSCWRGPFAQMATKRPPGAKKRRACSMCLMSAPFRNGGFITMRSTRPSAAGSTSRKSATVTEASGIRARRPAARRASISTASSCTPGRILVAAARRSPVPALGSKTRAPALYSRWPPAAAPTCAGPLACAPWALLGSVVIHHAGQISRL